MQNIVKNLQGRYDGITRTSAVGCTIARGYSLIHRFCSATDSDEERNMSFLIVEMAGKMDYRIYNRCRMFPPLLQAAGSVINTAGHAEIYACGDRVKSESL